MKLDVNELAEYLANTPFRVEGVYRYAKIGVPCAESTDSFRICISTYREDAISI